MDIMYEVLNELSGKMGSYMTCNSTRCSRIFEVGGGRCNSQLVNSKPTLSLCLDFVTFEGVE